MDTSLIKLSLAAYAWVEYQQASGAAKMQAVREWSGRLPAQLVLTPGTGHDATPAGALWGEAGGTYVHDRG